MNIVKNSILPFLIICCVIFTSSFNNNNHNIAILKWNNNDTLSNNQIIIIFQKRNYKNDTLISSSGSKTFSQKNLFYSEQGNFIEKELNPNNFTKDDTVQITTGNSIVMSYRYNIYYNSIYLFKPNDTIVFSYSTEGFPKVHTINRETPKGINVMSSFNSLHKIPDNPHVFKFKNKRERTTEEQYIYKKTIKDIELGKKSIIDSLYNIRQFDEEHYKLYTDYFLPPNEYNIKLLKRELELALPYNRYNLSGIVYQHYKIPNLKTTNGNVIDFRIFFDKIININDINIRNRDYLLYYSMQGILDNFSKKDIDKYFTLFSREISNKTLATSIKENYFLKQEKINTSQIELINSEREKKSFYDILKLSKGKIVYVDLWASWCLPCREAMPASTELREKLKNKDVIFIYLSIDKGFESWKNASIKENLITYPYSFILPNKLEYDLFQELEVKTIPRYLLFDKEGKLVHKNAPGPENKNELIDEIEKYLK